MSEGENRSESNSDSDIEQDESSVATAVGCSCAVCNDELSANQELHEECLLDFVGSEGVEVRESDVFATEVLEDDICHFKTMDDIQRLEEGVLYEFPDDNEETCEAHSQPRFDSISYTPLTEVIKTADISELRSLDRTLEDDIFKQKQANPCKILEKRDEGFIDKNIPQIPRKIGSKSGKREEERTTKTLNTIYRNTEAKECGSFLFENRTQDENNVIYSSDCFTDNEDDDEEMPFEASQPEHTHQDTNSIDSSDSYTDIQNDTNEITSRTTLSRWVKQDLNGTVHSSDSWTDTEENAHEFPLGVFQFGFQKQNEDETIYSSDGFADTEDNAQESTSDSNEPKSTVNPSRKNITSDNVLFNIDPSQQTRRDYMFDRAAFRVKRNSEDFNSNQELKKSRASFPKDIEQYEKKPVYNTEIKDSGASCSYSRNNSQQLNTGLTAKASTSRNKIFKSTMPIIAEMSEQEDAKVKKVADSSKTVTFTPLKRKQNTSKRNKCGVCKIRLGLCAIRCRCGNLYCAKHRYDKDHDCTFDYKAMGAEEIRKNNPQIIAEKVRKL